ncbi:MAG: RNA methyltransferase [Actinomycetota bacterium]|nr:RNA methyltransferase [Actinomycetota bacterium]
MYLVDGPTLLAEAIDAGVEIETVYVEPGALDHDAVWAARHAGLRVRDVTAGALAKVLELDAPQHMVAVAAQRRSRVDDLIAASSAAQRPLLVLAGLSDPGNVGTLVRVAEAAGCAGVLFGPDTADLYNPKTVRATAGAVFRVPVAGVDDLAGLLATLRAAGTPTVATTGGAEVPAPEAVDLTGAVAVVIGNEAHGLPAEVVDACDLAVRIPMEGRVESLNAAVAGAAVLFDAARQRRAGDPGRAAEPNGQTGTTVGHNVGPRDRRDTDARGTGEFGDG